MKRRGDKMQKQDRVSKKMRVAPAATETDAVPEPCPGMLAVFGIGDLAVEIFQSLSMISLARAACACRSWHDTIYAQLSALPFDQMPYARIARYGEHSRTALSAFQLLFELPRLRRLVIPPNAVSVLACCTPRGLLTGADRTRANIDAVSDLLGANADIGGIASGRALLARHDPRINNVDECRAVQNCGALFDYHKDAVVGVGLPLRATQVQWTDFIARHLTSRLPRVTDLTFDPCELNTNDFRVRVASAFGAWQPCRCYDRWLCPSSGLHPGLKKLKLARFYEAVLAVSGEGTDSVLSGIPLRTSASNDFRRTVLANLAQCSSLVSLELEHFNCGTLDLEQDQPNWRRADASDVWCLENNMFPVGNYVDWMDANIDIPDAALSRLTRLVLNNTNFDVAGVFAALLGAGNAQCLAELVIENRVRYHDMPASYRPHAAMPPTERNDVHAAKEDNIFFPSTSCTRVEKLLEACARVEKQLKTGPVLASLKQVSLATIFGAFGFIATRKFLSALPALEHLSVRALDMRCMARAQGRNLLDQLRGLAPPWISQFVLPADGAAACIGLRHLELNVLVAAADDLVDRYETMRLLSRFPNLETARLFVHMTFRELPTIESSVPHASSWHPDTPGYREHVSQIESRATDFLNSVAEMQQSGAGCLKLRQLTLALIIVLPILSPDLNVDVDQPVLRVVGGIALDMFSSAFANAMQRYYETHAAVTGISHLKPPAVKIVVELRARKYPERGAGDTTHEFALRGADASLVQVTGPV